MNTSLLSPGRRALLLSLAGTAAGCGIPASALAAADALRSKRLILLKLAGGNDGLNTVVPQSDPLYRRLRPTIAIAPRELQPLDNHLGLHPALKQLMAMYQNGELAVVLNVGYPKPNLSHFESGAMWDSGELLGTAARSGWWGKLTMQNKSSFQAAGLDATAISFDGQAAFAIGPDTQVLHAGQNVAELFEAPPVLKQAPPRSVAAASLAAILRDAADVRARVGRRLAGVPQPQWRTYERPFELQLRLVDWFMANGVLAPVLQLTLGGFDTHTLQAARHAELLEALDGGLGDLRARLMASGLWRDTVVMVFSEFGRRPAENNFGGTDHGTAGPVLVVGGSVSGGLIGNPPSMESLDSAGNLQHKLDFRRLYATVASGLFSLPVDPFAAGGHRPLELIAA